MCAPRSTRVNRCRSGPAAPDRRGALPRHRQASAWVGALVLGWWIGVLAYLLPRRAELRVAAADTAGAAVAAVCAFALVVGALWLQQCCKSPPRTRPTPPMPLQVELVEPQWLTTRGITESRDSSGDFSRVESPHDRSVPRRSGSAWRPQAGMAAFDGTAGACHSASSALVFTNRIELLKLAVIISLWAAVVGAFVSAIYRRQSESDQARMRELKHVYNLQLDREIFGAP